jgi:hypothetical protein
MSRVPELGELDPAAARRDQHIPARAAAAVRSLPSSHSEGCCVPFDGDVVGVRAGAEDDDGGWPPAARGVNRRMYTVATAAQCIPATAIYLEPTAPGRCCPPRSPLREGLMTADRGTWLRATGSMMLDQICSSGLRLVLAWRSRTSMRRARSRV